MSSSCLGPAGWLPEKLLSRPQVLRLVGGMVGGGRCWGETCFTDWALIQSSVLGPYYELLGSFGAHVLGADELL